MKGGGNLANFTVGRSEGVAYSNNNLTYSQFKTVKPTLKETNTKFIEKPILGGINSIGIIPTGEIIDVFMDMVSKFNY